MLGVSVLVLSAEIGGVTAALNPATGWPIPLWTIPAAFLAWIILWKGTFGVIENGVSLLGLVTVVFAVAAVKAHPDYGHLREDSRRPCRGRSRRTTGSWP